ncbi:MAG: hypothetical protein ABIR16_03230 [Dokdonella sp.]
MQRNIVPTGKLTRALGITLALPFFISTAANAGVSGVDAGTARADVDQAIETANTEFNRWRDYALASITPRFAWVSMPSLDEVTPRITDAFGSARPSVFSTSLSIGGGSAARLGLSVATGAVSDTPSRTASSVQQLIETPQIGLQRSVATPSISLALGESTVVGVSAVLAYQRFASLGMGLADFTVSQRPTTWASRESSFGTGVRLDSFQQITPRLALTAGYQTRVDMDAFNTYRGVYADAGDFDIPAQTSFGASYALTPNFSTDLGIDRLNYSDIKPFTSNGLPLRFLALLGDGLSPNFAWQDLTVYSAGWSWRNSVLGELRFRYTTRQQPLPTSALLAQALQDDISRYSLSMGWSRAAGKKSRISLLANYASAPYLVGAPSYNSQNGSQPNRLEFQALWSLGF